MLAVLPSQTTPLAHRRGRSRQVSNAALARQASEERRTIVQSRLFLRATILPSPQLISTSSSYFPPPLPISYSPSPPPSPSIPPPMANTHDTATTIPSSSSNSDPSFRSLTPSPSHSPSPPASNSLSPTYFDSPPSPPRSLEDQVHVAYALDDIHLAKILLLKLKGIEVTSDDDPRIAAVQDEDFDVCFVPSGRLLDDEAEKAVLEQQAKAVAAMEEQQRVQRLMACERIWEEDRQKMREQRLEAQRLRDLEDKRRAEELERVRVRLAEEEEKRRKALEAAEAELVHARSVKPQRPRLARTQRNVVSYESLSDLRASRSAGSSPTVPEQSFVYNFMTPLPSKSASSTPPRRNVGLPSPPTKEKHANHKRAISPSPPTFHHEAVTVPFQEVLASMYGPLFPLTAAEQRSSRSPSAGHSRECRIGRGDLLDILLKVDWDVKDRSSVKGKGRMAERRDSYMSTKSNTSDNTCAACSAASSSTSPQSSTSSSPSPVSSRAGSWLSFRSSSSSSSSTSSKSSIASTSTDLTTPSTSPVATSWFKSAARSRRSIVPPLFSRSILNSETPLCHSCSSRCRLVSVPPSESPLPLEDVASIKEGSEPSRQRHTAVNPSKLRSAVQRMSRFVELARGFQNAYMNAALFSVSASADCFEDRQALYAGSGAIGMMGGAPRGSMYTIHAATSRRSRLETCREESRPSGSRAEKRDIQTFLRPMAFSDTTWQPSPDDNFDPLFDSPSDDYATTYIPLVSLYPPSTPHTTLPNPLPYPLVFKPLSPPSGIPLRRFAPTQTPMHAPFIDPYIPAPEPPIPAVSWRTRAIANPVYLRLKALQNITWSRGMLWEGRAREGGLGCGREKMIGVAFEGLGRSLLGVKGRRGGVVYEWVN